MQFQYVDAATESLPGKVPPVIFETSLDIDVKDQVVFFATRCRFIAYLINAA